MKSRKIRMGIFCGIVATIVIVVLLKPTEEDDTEHMRTNCDAGNHCTLFVQLPSDMEGKIKIDELSATRRANALGPVPYTIVTLYYFDRATSPAKTPTARQEYHWIYRDMTLKNIGLVALEDSTGTVRMTAKPD